MDAEEATFTLRQAGSADEATVCALMETGGMALADDWIDGTVAVDSAGFVVGYVRVQQTDKGPHIAPVAVRPDWQGRGVGRALMDQAVRDNGPVKLVSRGEAAGFYRRIGCVEMGFDEISGELEEDCQHCPDREVCQPVAFSYAGEERHG